MGREGTTKSLSRRRLLRTAAKGATAGAAASASGCLGGRADGLKIGVLQPYTGALRRWGHVSTWGFLSGLAHRHGEGFVPVEAREMRTGGSVALETEEPEYEVLFRPSGTPSSTESFAESLVVKEGVDVLFGVVDTESAVRVINNVVRPNGALYVAGGVDSVEVVGDPSLCSRNVFRANEHVGMEARAESKYIAEETDTETVHLLAVEDAFGRGVMREYRKALGEYGVDVVGERLVPPGFAEAEFGGVLEDIDDGADGVAVAFGGGTAEPFLSGFFEGNVSGSLDLRAYGSLPGELGLELVGGVLEDVLGEITEEGIEETNLGGLASRYHWNQYDNPTNDDLVSGFDEVYGTLPALYAGGAFAAGSAVAQAVEKTGSGDPGDVAEAMYGMTVEETPKGEGAYTFREHNNQAKSPMTVAKVVPNDESEWDAPIMPGEPLLRVDADEAALSVDDPDMECDLTT